MKKIFLLLPILLVVNVGFAQSASFGDFGSLTVDSFIKMMRDYPNSEFKTKTINSIISTLQSFLPKQESITVVDLPRNFTDSSCKKISQTLWEGKTDSDTSGDVTRLQTFLKYFSEKNSISGSSASELKIDGVYGYKTKSEVIDFQSKFYIKQTGAVGPLTLAKINSMICDGVNRPAGNNNCPISACNMLRCPSGQRAVLETPVYGADGCQTNMCAAYCAVN